MPTLTRKQVHDSPASWQIFFDGVRIGTLSERIGITGRPDHWNWSCGFTPGGKPGEERHGTAPSFEAARDAFETAWRDYLPKHTEADLEVCRAHDRATAEKNAARDKGLRLPPPEVAPGRPASRFRRCACGKVFDMQAPAEVFVHVPHLDAADAAAAPRRSARR